jgi:8-oxo-dGTP pyrophosphatase MutT (NUDIX family)
MGVLDRASLHVLACPFHSGRWRFTVVLARHGDYFLLVFNIARQCWELPGGRRQGRESALQCAQRELLEEGGAVGRQFRRWGLLHVQEPQRCLLGVVFCCDVASQGLGSVPEEIAGTRYWRPGEVIEGLADIDRALIEAATGRMQVTQVVGGGTTWQMLPYGA